MGPNKPQIQYKSGQTKSNRVDSGWSENWLGWFSHYCSKRVLSNGQQQQSQQAAANWAHEQDQFVGQATPVRAMRPDHSGWAIRFDTSQGHADICVSLCSLRPLIDIHKDGS